MKITTENYLDFCKSHYVNPHLLVIEEFENDLKTLRYIKSLFRKYISGSNDINFTTLINHFIYVYNCFGESIIEICFCNFGDYYYELLKSMLTYLGILTSEHNSVCINGKVIFFDDIIINLSFINQLRQCKHQFK